MTFPDITSCPLAWARGAGVYQARQAKGRRLVALKVSRLGPDAAEEAPSVRRKAAVLRNLDHPGIVAFLEAGESNGRAFSMEWLAARNWASGCATVRSHRATRSAWRRG